MERLHRSPSVMRGMRVDYTADSFTPRSRRGSETVPGEGESREGTVKYRGRFRLADHYCGSSSACCESSWTLPFKLTRYFRVKPRRGGSSVCPDKTTSSSRELIQRFALKYECPAFKNCAALGSPATTTFAKSISFSVAGSYT